MLSSMAAATGHNTDTASPLKSTGHRTIWDHEHHVDPHLFGKREDAI